LILSSLASSYCIVDPIGNHTDSEILHLVSDLGTNSSGALSWLNFISRFGFRNSRVGLRLSSSISIGELDRAKSSPR
jgi:hypothetical protein